jgi:hypothetical protein
MLVAVAVAAAEAVEGWPGGSTSGSELLLRWPPAAGPSLASASEALRELCARMAAAARCAAEEEGRPEGPGSRPLRDVLASEGTPPPTLLAPLSALAEEAAEAATE